MSCLFDPFGCLSAGFWQLVGMVPLWGWAVAALLIVGMVWKFAGWPGLIALGGVFGFILGRRSEPVDTDEIWPHPDKPVRTPKPVKSRKAFRDWINGDDA